MKTTGVNLSQINVNAIFNPTYLSKYRWVREPVDIRDHIYQIAPLTLVPKIDLRQYCSPIEDQGYLGSCTGNAIAGQIELIDRKNGKQLDVSRLFIYYEERVLEGSVRWDAGAYIRDGIKVCYTKGAPLESLWPYNQSRWATRPSTSAYTDALKRKVTGYQRCTNFNAVKNALAAGNPVVIGFDVYESFEGTWGNIPHGQSGSGMMPMPNKATEQILGGHAVCIVGYDDTLNGGRFIVRNSWGTGWGDNGYFYMPYGVIQDTTMSSDFWLISAVRNP
ncbi:Peptidase_C1 domain containing protein [uncultured Caudovirales phage]|uniref:Peptidase_C1 domain containing protein n=1 Tax=uncultured Caudovirales phage TaxID=2100421 RepID=A0A6J5KXM7_9CAUD|nr:Peptidase_C1 domain containing protein [uncultured Caudovirales phage]CAB5208913.1 Peptidase_C1 domain containing protein [uncultured Caudovirales phage]